MTAPPAAAGIETALRRADHAWCRSTADEPLDPERLGVLAHAVPASGDGEDVARLRRELRDACAALEDADRRREDLAAELRRHVDAQERRAVRAEHERDRLRAEIADLKCERDEARADLASANATIVQWERGHQNEVLPYTGSLEKDVAELRAEVAELRTDRDREHAEAVRAISALEVARRERDNERKRCELAEQDITQLAARLDQLAEIEGRPRERHRHAWEWQPGLKPMPLPCNCGQPWPLRRPPDLATVVPLRNSKGSTR